MTLYDPAAIRAVFGPWTLGLAREDAGPRARGLQRARVQALTRDVLCVAPWKPRGDTVPRVAGKTRAANAWVY